MVGAVKEGSIATPSNLGQAWSSAMHSRSSPEAPTWRARRKRSGPLRLEYIGLKLLRFTFSCRSSASLLKAPGVPGVQDRT